MAHGFILGVCVLVVSGLAVAPLCEAGTRDDVVDGNYVTGFLMWNDAQGGIAWNPAAQSEDPGGPVGAQGALEDQKRTANIYTNNLLGVKVDDPPVVEFIGEPLTKTVYVNVSRLIRLDLFFTNCQGYQDSSGNTINLRVEVKGGSRLFAGASGLPSISYGTAQYRSPPPSVPGTHCLRSFRMPSEMDVLPAGTTLTIRIEHGPQQQDHRYGLAADHRSILQIPFYPSEEAVYRVPELAATLAAPPPTQETSPEVLALIASAGLGRRGRRAAVLVLIGVAVSGCTSSPTVLDSGPGGTARTQLIHDDGNGTGLTNGTTGTILGQVFDPDGRLVDGAHVSLFGTSFSAITGRLGRFTFTGVVPGTHTLHVDRADFLVFESGIRVQAGTILKVDVPLAFADERSRDARWHRHDDWDGAQILPLHETTVTSGGGIPYFILPIGKTILPGARELEITVTWTMEWVSAVSFIFSSNVEEPGSGNGTETFWHASGDPIRVQVGWEMADVGHQKFSTWGSMQLGREFVRPQDLVLRKVEPESYEVKMVLRKGAVPFERPHKDFWGANTTATVLDKVVVHHGSKGYCVLFCAPLDLENFPTVSLAEFNYSWAPMVMVPPQTLWLEARLQQTQAMLPNDPAWRFTIKGAASPRYYDYLEGTWCAARIKETNARDVPANASEASTRTWTYRIPLNPEEADPFYADGTNWCFFAAPMDQTSYLANHLANKPPSGLEESEEGAPPLELTVIAHRTPLSPG